MHKEKRELKPQKIHLPKAQKRAILFKSQFNLLKCFKILISFCLCASSLNHSNWKCTFRLYDLDKCYAYSFAYARLKILSSIFFHPICKSRNSILIPCHHVSVKETTSPTPCVITDLITDMAKRLKLQISSFFFT